MNRRSRHIVRNLIAGLMLGMGGSLLLTIYGIVDWSSLWGDVTVAAGVVVGLAISFLPAPRSRGPAASPQ